MKPFHLLVCCALLALASTAKTEEDGRELTFGSLSHFGSGGGNSGGGGFGWGSGQGSPYGGQGGHYPSQGRSGGGHGSGSGSGDDSGSGSGDDSGSGSSSDRSWSGSSGQQSSGGNDGGKYDNSEHGHGGGFGNSDHEYQGGNSGSWNDHGHGQSPGNSGDCNKGGTNNSTTTGNSGGGNSTAGTNISVNSTKGGEDVNIRPDNTTNDSRSPTANSTGSCPAQSDCVKFNMTKVSSGLCKNSTCEYRVCMIIDQTGKCLKQGSYSHSCIKDDEVCQQAAGFAAAMEMNQGLVDGFVQCQTVAADQVAEFLLKDGGNCDGSAGKDFGSGHRATCSARDAGTASCTGNKPEQECVWTVRAPKTCGNTGGGGGDPHFKLWNETRYPFHGECDLLLLHNEEFNHGTGLDIHVRTKIDDFFSFIEFAAIRIGNDVLEIATGGKFWLNGVEGSDADLPDVLADFTISAPYQELDSKAVTYRIDLNHDDYIKVRAYKKFISLDVFGLPGDFEHSIGLLGHYHTGDLVARDGKKIIEDPDEFGMEWQVRETDPQLFRHLRAPIYPSKCVMPQKLDAEGRRLRFKPAEVKQAETACAHKNQHDFDFCVLDVLATGDMGMANAW